MWANNWLVFWFELLLVSDLARLSLTIESIHFLAFSQLQSNGGEGKCMYTWILGWNKTLINSHLNYFLFINLNRIRFIRTDCIEKASPFHPADAGNFMAFINSPFIHFYFFFMYHFGINKIISNNFECYAVPHYTEDLGCDCQSTEEEKKLAFISDVKYWKLISVVKRHSECTGDDSMLDDGRPEGRMNDTIETGRRLKLIDKH